MKKKIAMPVLTLKIPKAEDYPVTPPPLNKQEENIKNSMYIFFDTCFSDQL